MSEHRIHLARGGILQIAKLCHQLLSNKCDCCIKGKYPPKIKMCDSLSQTNTLCHHPMKVNGD